MESQLTAVLAGNYTPPDPVGRSERVTTSNKTRAVTFAAVKVPRESIIEATQKVRGPAGLCKDAPEAPPEQSVSSAGTHVSVVQKRHQPITTL